MTAICRLVKTSCFSWLGKWVVSTFYCISNGVRPALVLVVCILVCSYEAKNIQNKNTKICEIIKKNLQIPSSSVFVHYASQIRWQFVARDFNLFSSTHFVSFSFCKIKEKIYIGKKTSSNHTRKSFRSLGKPNSFELRERKWSSFQFVARDFNLFSSAAHFVYSTSGTLVLAKSRRKFILDS